jgi:hypothetical protein
MAGPSLPTSTEMLLNNLRGWDSLAILPPERRVKPPHIRWNVRVPRAEPEQKVGMRPIETGWKRKIREHDTGHVRFHSYPMIDSPVSQIPAVIRWQQGIPPPITPLGLDLFVLVP